MKGRKLKNNSTFRSLARLVVVFRNVFLWERLHLFQHFPLFTEVSFGFSFAYDTIFPQSPLGNILSYRWRTKPPLLVFEPTIPLHIMKWTSSYKEWAFWIMRVWSGWCKWECKWGMTFDKREDCVAGTILWLLFGSCYRPMDWYV